MDPPLQGLDLTFGALPNGSLGFSVVGTFLCQLIGSQVGHSTRAYSRRSPLFTRDGMGMGGFGGRSGRINVRIWSGIHSRHWRFPGGRKRGGGLNSCQMMR